VSGQLILLAQLLLTFIIVRLCLQTPVVTTDRKSTICEWIIEEAALISLLKQAAQSVVCSNEPTRVIGQITSRGREMRLGESAPVHWYPWVIGFHTNRFVSASSM